MSVIRPGVEAALFQTTNRSLALGDAVRVFTYAHKSEEDLSEEAAEATPTTRTGASHSLGARGLRTSRVDPFHSSTSHPQRACFPASVQLTPTGHPRWFLEDIIRVGAIEAGQRGMTFKANW